MAWGLRVYADLYWVPEGTGGVTVMSTSGLANQPGYGSQAGSPGPIPNAQTLRLQVSEPITGVAGTPPNSGQIQAAVTQSAVDLNAQITTAVVQQIQAWQSAGG